MMMGSTSFWFAFVAAALAAYPIYRLLLLTKSRQTIDPHAPETHQVKQGTPTMGGLIVLVGFVVGLLGTQYAAVAAPLTVFLGFAIIGFVDDFVVPKLIKKRGLGWLPKLAMQFAAAGGGAFFARQPFEPVAFGVIAFCILFFANAFNFLDGLDALAGSVFLALAIALWGHSPELVAAISGGILAFLFLNAPPAKVFMGDVGSLPIGGVIGLIVANVLLDRPELTPNMAAVTAILVLELGLVPLQVGFYKLTKKRIFIMAPIHHAFEKKGWKESKVVWSFFLVQVLLSVASLSLDAQSCWIVMAVAYSSVLLILNRGPQKV